MKNKINIKLLFLAICNTLVCSMLIIFKTPSLVPTLFSLNQNVICLSTKWLLFLCVIIPTIFYILSEVLKKHPRLNFLFKMLFVLGIYENMLIFICTSLTPAFYIGDKSPIPLSLVWFLPLAVIFSILGIKIKTIPYKSRLGVNVKYTTATEFLWKQAHIFARDIMCATGFVLCILSIVFSFFNLLLIELIIFLCLIILDYILVVWYAKAPYKKYIKMKGKKDVIDKSKEILEAVKNMENTDNIKENQKKED